MQLDREKLSKLRLKAKDYDNNEFMIEVDVTHRAHMVVLPDLFINRPSSRVTEYPSIIHSNTKVPLLVDHAYIGTVGSSTSDDLVDVYLMCDEEPESHYFLIIPSLAFIGDYSNGIRAKSVYKMSGVISGVHTDEVMSRGYRSTVVDIKHNESKVNSYLGHLEPIQEELRLSVMDIALNGINEDSTNTRAHVGTKDEGTFVSNGNMIPSTQFIIIGELNKILPDTVANGIDLWINRIEPRAFGTYVFSNNELHNVKKGLLAIPLNF